MSGTRAALTRDVPRLRPLPPPVTRPRGWLLVIAPLLVVAVCGFAVGSAPREALVISAAVLSAVVLVARVEWAALAVIGTAVFEDYLDLLSRWSTEWLALVLLLAWAVRRGRGPLHERRHRFLLLPASVLGAVLLLAALMHPHGADGLKVLLGYAELLAVAVVLADVLSGPLRPRRAAGVFVVSCAVAAVCGIATAALRAPHRVSGPLESPDQLAFFLIAALPLVGTLRAWGSGRVWPAWTVFAVVLVGIVGSQSRGAWVALGVMLVLVVATGVLSLRYAGAAVVVVATGVAFVLAALPHPVGDAWTDQQRYAETGLSQRTELWRAAAAMTREHPLLGLGPGAFALYHQDFGDQDPRITARDLDVAHSTPLEASAELGVLGAVALFAVFLVPAVVAGLRWRRDGSALAAATCLGMAGLVAASLFETEQLRLPLWFLAALAASLTYGARRRLPLLALDSSGQVRPG